MKTQEIKAGNTVTTIHGEELTILDVKSIPVKKQGKPTGKTETFILAESGGSQCWFPVSKLEGKDSN